MAYGILRTCVAVGVLSLSVLGMSPVARAGLSIDSSVGGAPTGVNYANFDGLPLGATGGVSNGDHRFLHRGRPGGAGIAIGIVCRTVSL